MRSIERLVLRLGLAFAFLYPPINALFDPDSWFGYFPSFIQKLAPEPVLLYGFGALEVAIALWLLSGKKIFWPALAAAIILVSIVIFNVPEFQVLFRDLALAAMAIALALDSALRHHPNQTLEESKK